MPRNPNTRNFSLPPGRRSRYLTESQTISHLYLSNSVCWLAPFLIEAAKEVPLHNLLSITGYKTRSLRQDFTQGCTYKHGNRYTISVVTHIHSNKKHIARSIGSVLEVVAHELMHLTDMSHSPDRWLLELRISKRFVKLLNKWGCKDTTHGPRTLEFL